MKEPPESSRSAAAGFQEYPKVLYNTEGKGTHTLARDADHETELLADGRWSPDANQATAPAADHGAGQTEAQPTESDMLVFIAEAYDVKISKARKHLEEHGREAVLAEMKAEEQS